jgi:hypothetical protein
MSIGAVKIVYVNSDKVKRTSGKAHDFQFNIDIGTQHNEFEYDHVTVLNASVPKTWYLINDNNNTFIVEEVNTLTTTTINRITITLSIGQYDIGSLLFEMMSKISSAGLLFAYNNAFSTVSGKITFNCSNAIPGLISNFIFNNSLGRIFGFDIGTYEFTIGGGGSFLTSENMIKLQITENIFIKSSMVDGFESNQTLLALPTGSTPFFSNIVYFNPDPYATAVKLSRIHSNIYRFFLTDSYDNLLDTNGIACSFTIMMFKRDIVNEHVGKKLIYGNAENHGIQRI